MGPKTVGPGAAAPLAPPLNAALIPPTSYLPTYLPTYLPAHLPTL